MTDPKDLLLRFDRHVRAKGWPRDYLAVLFVYLFVCLLVCLFVTLLEINGHKQRATGPLVPGLHHGLI